MKNFIIGNISLQAPCSPSNNFPEPLVNGLLDRVPSPAKDPDLSIPSDARKLPGRVSLLMPPKCGALVEKLSYARGSTRVVAPSIGPAQQDTFVDPLTSHDTSVKLKRDCAPVSPSQAPLVLTAAPTGSSCQDCPRIDLVALVREKQKTEKLQRKKQSTLVLREDLRRREDPRGPKPGRFR